MCAAVILQREAGQPENQLIKETPPLNLPFKVRCRTRLELDQSFRRSADVRAAFV